MLSFDQLATPQTPNDVMAQFLAGLQGIGQIVQFGVGMSDPVGTGNLSAFGPAAVSFNCVVRIDTTGTLGTGVFSFSTDGGLTFPGGQSAIIIPASGLYAMPGTGVTLVFAAGRYNPTSSFLVGETFLFPATVPTFPISDWEPLAAMRTALQANAVSLSDFNTLIAKIAKGGFASTAVGAWADSVGAGVFNELRKPGQQAKGQVTLTCPATAGPYVLTAGQLLIAVAQTGLVFTNVAAVMIPSGGSVNATMQGAQIGAAFNAPTHVSGVSVLVLQTALPGVTIDNPPILGTVGHTGTGTGTLVLAGTPTQSISAIVKITTGGLPAVMKYKYSLDGGSTYIGPFTGSQNLIVAGVTGTFSGTFLQGDVYTFGTSWLTQLGLDREADAAYMNRCINKWGSLSPNSPGSMYVFQAQQAAQEIQSVTVQADPTVAGQVNVLVGGPAGAVSAGAITASGNRLQPRAALCDLVNVQNQQNQTIALSAQVFVRSGSLDAAKVFAANQLAALQTTIGAAGKIFYVGNQQNSPAAVLAAVPGFDHIELFTMGGGTVDIQLLSPFFPIFDLTALTWIGV